MLKNPTMYETDIPSANSLPFLAKFLLLRCLVCVVVTARELWWMNQE
jgi:hypothetical protein